MNDHYSTLIAEKENNINLQQPQNEQLVNKQRINYRIRCSNCGEPGHKICDNVVAPEERAVIDRKLQDFKEKKSPEKKDYRIRCSNCGEPGHTICENLIAPDERATIDREFQIFTEKRIKALERDRLKKAEERKKT